LLDAWQVAPDDAQELKRVIRLNLAAWAPQLPVLRHALQVVTPKAEQPGRDPVSVWVSGDGKTFATFSDDGGFQRWDLATGRPLGRRCLRPGEWAEAVRADGPRLATLVPLLGDGRQRAFVREAANGRVLCGPILHAGASELDVNLQPRFALGGEVLWTAGQGNPHTVRFWDAATGAEMGPALSVNDGESFLLVGTREGGKAVVVFPQGDF